MYALGCWVLLYNYGFHVQDLDLSNVGVTAQGIQALAPHLPHAARLRAIRLASNPLGAPGADLLAPHLPHLTSLQTLTLTDAHLACHNTTRLAAYGARARATDGAAAGTAAQAAAGTGTGAGSGTASSSGRSRSPSQSSGRGSHSSGSRCCCCTHCSSTAADPPAHAAAAGPAAAAAPAADCSTDCFSMFSKDLSHLASLRDLHLGGNFLCMNSCASLARITLPRLTMLQSLSLSHNALGDRGMHAVVDALHAANTLSTLDTLELAHCELSEARSYAWMTNFLPHAQSLRRLDLSENEGIADGGVGTIARWLPHMKALQELKLSGTGVSPAGEAYIREVQDALGGKLNVLEVRRPCTFNNALQCRRFYLMYVYCMGPEFLVSCTGPELQYTSVAGMQVRLAFSHLPCDSYKQTSSMSQY